MWIIATTCAKMEDVAAKPALRGTKQSKRSMASYTPACYSAAEQWNMVVIVRDKRDTRGGTIVIYNRDLVPQRNRGGSS